MPSCPTALLLLALIAPAFAGEAPTYHQHIAPILLEYCAGCHRPGGPGPFSLLTYDDARRHAHEIAAVTFRRYMPPWLPEPGFGEFQDERRLTGAEIQTIEQWVRAGAPEGPGASQPPVLPSGWQLGEPDLVITAAKPISARADGPDVFWNFVLSPGLRQTRYVEAIEIRPGNARSVHHANLLIDRSRSGRYREKASGGGFPGMDVTLESDTFDPDSHFLFWKPGGTPWREPAGMAWRLDPGNDLILNVHLHPSGKAESVQPSVGLYFTREAPSKFPMLIQLEHDGALDIPPGQPDFLVSDDFRLPLDVDVLAVYPHAHYLGKLLEGFATLPDGKRQWLIRIPDWDLNWQAVYRLRSPMFLPKGTVVSMRFHYDNSSVNPRNPNSPPKRVRGGNQSTDEMSHLWLQVLPRGSGDRRIELQEALMRHRLEKYPADFLAHFNLGALLLRRNDAASALDHLRAALLAEPGQPAALNTYGAALELSGKPDEAAVQFRRVLQIRPGDTDARYNLAAALAEQDRLEEAASELRQIVSIVPQDEKARARLMEIVKAAGDRAAAEGRLPAAIASYRELVALDPGDADLHTNYGTLLARSGDLPAAIGQFEAALKLNPSHEAARRNLRIAQQKMAH
ncbi:MAG TPA: tetratricopeptide repeat protein [Bryobacteraceae bacterium]|nr:tetratricopeptide repeat protein [Bryobacteraceae bacterium]